MASHTSKSIWLGCGCAAGPGGSGATGTGMDCTTCGAGTILVGANGSACPCPKAGQTTPVRHRLARMTDERILPVIGIVRACMTLKHLKTSRLYGTSQHFLIWAT